MLPFLCRAQEASSLDGFSIAVNPFVGKIIKHNYRFPPLPERSSGLDITVLKQTNGRKAWQQRRSYPKIGLGLTYTNYGLDSVYGRCIGVYPAIPLSIVRGKRLSWQMKFGIGVGYVSRSFERHPTWDTVNNLIGSKLNNFTLLATDLRYSLSRHLSVQAGLTLTHISNGSFRLPNLGVNLAAGHLGITYAPGNSEPERIVRDLPVRSNRWLVQARMGFGFTEIAANDGPLYPVYLPSLFLSRRYANGKNKMFAGLDYTYYQSLYTFFRSNEIHPGRERRYASQACIFLGNEFLLGRFGLVTQVGVPFMKTYRENEGWYQCKLGYNFYVINSESGPLKELTIHTYIKANKLEADIIEFGMGLGI